MGRADRPSAMSHSVFDEPSYTGRADLAPEPASVAQRLDREAIDETPGDEAARSVHDEPTALAPPPPNALTYAAWYQDRLGNTGPVFSWALTGLIALASGPLALLSALLGVGVVSGGGSVGLLSQAYFLNAVIFGPITEEVLKLAPATLIMETRPWCYRSAAQPVVIGVVSGLAFASIENLLYLNVYIEEPSDLITLWRWTVCVALHTACSAIGGLGLARVRGAALAHRRQPNLAAGSRYLLAAIIIHGSYNALAISFELAGVF